MDQPFDARPVTKRHLKRIEAFCRRRPGMGWPHAVPPDQRECTEGLVDGLATPRGRSDFSRTSRGRSNNRIRVPRLPFARVSRTPSPLLRLGVKGILLHSLWSMNAIESPNGHRSKAPATRTQESFVDIDPHNDALGFDVRPQGREK